MGKNKFYKDIHGREIYEVSGSFYIKEGNTMNKAPKFLQHWLKGFIHKNDNKLIWEIY